MDFIYKNNIPFPMDVIFRFAILGSLSQDPVNFVFSCIRFLKTKTGLLIAMGSIAMHIERQNYVYFILSCPVFMYCNIGSGTSWLLAILTANAIASCLAFCYINNAGTYAFWSVFKNFFAD